MHEIQIRSLLRRGLEVLEIAGMAGKIDSQWEQYFGFPESFGVLGRLRLHKEGGNLAVDFRTSSTQKKLCHSSPKGASIYLTTSILATTEVSVSQLERKMKCTFLHVGLTVNQEQGPYLVSGLRIDEVSFCCYVIVCIGENKAKLMTFCHQ